MIIVITTPNNEEYSSFNIVARQIKKIIEDQFIVTPSLDDIYDIHIHVGTVDTMRKYSRNLDTSKTIIYTVTETPEIDSSWIDVLERCLQIWTPSRFCSNSFSKVLESSKIKIIPHGITSRELLPLEKIIKKNDDGVFTILWQGRRIMQDKNGSLGDGDRKRGFLVLEAFQEANLPKSRLILKSVPNMAQPVECDLRIDPIWYISKNLDRAQINEIDASCDLFVWPTMGEGFGLIPLEKLANGIPVLVTDWSGPKDYLSDFELPRLPYSIIEVPSKHGSKVSFADVSKKDLIDALRSAHLNQFELNRIGYDLATIARTKWDINLIMKDNIMGELSKLSI